MYISGVITLFADSKCCSVCVCVCVHICVHVSSINLKITTSNSFNPTEVSDKLIVKCTSTSLNLRHTLESPIPVQVRLLTCSIKFMSDCTDVCV